MSLVPASFPATLWDGMTGNNFRTSRADVINPDSEDWDRIVSEVIAVQNQLGMTVAFTIVPEATDSDEVAVTAQLKNGDGTAVTNTPVLDVYLSDDSGGVEVAAVAATSTTFDEGTVMIEETTDLRWKVKASDEGRVSITLGDNGDVAVYLAVLLPNGQLFVSDVLTLTT